MKKEKFALMMSCLISTAVLATAPAFDSANWSSTSYFSNKNSSLRHTGFNSYAPTSVLLTPFNGIDSEVNFNMQLLSMHDSLLKFDSDDELKVNFNVQDDDLLEFYSGDELMMPDQPNALSSSIDFWLPKPDMMILTWQLQQALDQSNNQAYLNQPNHVRRRSIDY